MCRSFAIASAAVLSALAVPLCAEAAPFVRLDDYSGHDLQVVGFEIARPVQVTVDAVGVEGDWAWRHSFARGFVRSFRLSDWHDDRGPLATAWIVESTTRKVVWAQDESRRRDRSSDRDDDDDESTIRVERTLELQPGRYELYAWANTWMSDSRYGQHEWHDGVVSIGWRDHGDRRSLRRAYRDCYVQLSAAGLGESDVPRFNPSGDIPGTVYRATGLKDEAFVRSGFTVDRPMSIRIYALGEMPGDWRQAADGGYIVNRETRERVWETGDRDFEDAGGASKNRVFDREITLQAGRYELCYGTDDSHSLEEWNAAPPYDPLNWGITILPGKGFDASAFHAQGELARDDAVVDLTKARDDDSLEKGFRLARETELHIVALGEWADEFADAGWISDARSGRVVWEMTERNTVGAGGAEKNRMFDGVVRLPAGDYIAHYDTDDSHAYREWNAAPPWDRSAWGLAIYPGRGASSADIQVTDISSAEMRATVHGDALVSIVRVRDRADKRDAFTLDRDGRVHIYALGEGDDGEMYDYAWIEDDRSGKVVWEMTWRNTRHAGGARKNRVFDDEIRLDAGTYQVHYVTDGSHSYRGWNAGKPRDPDAWGITVTRAGN